MQAPEARVRWPRPCRSPCHCGLTVDDAIVLQDSNKLTLRLLPCDVLARVAPVEYQVAHSKSSLPSGSPSPGCPVAALEPRVEPRVYERDGFAVTLWTYYEPAAPREVSPADYASALERLHAGMRKLDVRAPHFTDRVEQAQQIVASRDRTPALGDADRELLGETLRSLRRVIGDRGAAEQLLHGEPHPGNVLTTRNGPLFIDLETCCRGPVEFDLAHAPEEVSEHYPDIDQDLLRDCRTLVLAMITTWRWDRDDQLPNGRQLGTEWLSQIRSRSADGRSGDELSGCGQPVAEGRQLQSVAYLAGQAVELRTAAIGRVLLGIEQADPHLPPRHPVPPAQPTAARPPAGSRG